MKRSEGEHFHSQSDIHTKPRHEPEHWRDKLGRREHHTDRTAILSNGDGCAVRAVPEIFRRGDDLLNLTVACPTFALPHSLSRRQDCTLAPLNSRRDRYPRPAHPDLRPDTNNRPCLNGLANCRFACVRIWQVWDGEAGCGIVFLEGWLVSRHRRLRFWLQDPRSGRKIDRCRF